jgi:hypothetical protein
MPLSEQEQRLLEEMERHLMTNDADVVSTSGGRRSVNYRNVVYGAILVLAGLAGLIVALSTQLIVVGVIGFAAMVGGVVLAITPLRESASAAPSAQRRRTAPSAPTFMDRMNARWDRRQEGR